MSATGAKERIVLDIADYMKRHGMTASSAAPKMGLTSKRLHRILRGHHVHETKGSLQRYMEGLVNATSKHILTG